MLIFRRPWWRREGLDFYHCPGGHQPVWTRWFRQPPGFWLIPRLTELSAAHQQRRLVGWVGGRAGYAILTNSDLELGVWTIVLFNNDSQAGGMPIGRCVQPHLTWLTRCYKSSLLLLKLYKHTCGLMFFFFLVCAYAIIVPFLSDAKFPIMPSCCLEWNLS